VGADLVVRGVARGVVPEAEGSVAGAR
jgi:hypothetical protein